MQIGSNVFSRLSSQFATLLSTVVLATAAQAAITGKVFLDYNGNGVFDTTGTVGTPPTPTAVDTGVAGVTVASFGVTGAGPDAAVGTADDVLGACGPIVTSDATTLTLGNYSLSTTSCLAGAPIRVTFSGVPAPLRAGHGSLTSVQFVNDGATTANLPLTNPTKFCENNPLLVTSCYVLGNQVSGANAARDVLVTTRYSSGGTTEAAASTPLPGHIAIASQVGSTFGLAFQQSQQRLFSAAYMKHKFGFGPSGSGAIYAVNPTTSTSTLFVDINAASMADPARPGLFGPGAAGADPFGGPDAASAEAVSHISWGDIDLSADQSTLYALNQTNLRIYAFPTSSASITSSTAVTVLPPIPFPAAYPGCAAARLNTTSNDGLVGPQAMGLGVRDGGLYVGARCTRRFALDPGTFYVFRYDIAAGTWDAAPALSFPTNGLNSSGLQVFGQISDIDFAGNGDMILAIRNIATDYVFFPSAAASTGMVVRACLVGGVYTLENNGSCGTLTGAGVGNNNGPGNGQFFSPDLAADGQTHSQQGGIAILPGSDAVVSTSYDQFRLYEANMSWFGLTSGANLKDYQVLTAPSPTAADPFDAKSGALGELELMCKAAPVEIGNRLWRDTNNNGIQDPNEPPLAGVTVELRSATNVLLATAVTDANGQYVFSNDKRGYPVAGNDGTAMGGFTDDGQGGTASTAALRYGVMFSTGDVLTVRIPNGQAPLNGLTLTTVNAGPDAALDSNFALDGGIASASVTVGAPGANDHTIDAGFVVPTIDLTIAKALTSAGPYIPGATAQYSLTASNRGPASAQERIVVKDCVPTGLTSATASGTGWTCSTAAGPTVVGSLTCSAVITCTRDAGTGVLTASGATATAAPITVTATVAAGATGALVNYAQVNPATGETLLESNVLGAANGGYETGAPGTDSNNDASASLTASPAPTIDLTITKALTSAGPYIPGATAQYSLTASNLGPASAQERIVVKDCVPTGLTSATASGTGWTCSTAAGPTVVGSLTCSAVITCTRDAGTGVLTASGATATAAPISVTATVAAGATGALVNYAQVNPATNETLLESNVLGTTNGGYETGAPGTDSNNDASASLTASPAPTIDLTVAKTITSVGPYIAGSTVAYSISASNLGPASAQERIVVKDCVPTGLTAATASGTGWTCSTAAGPTVVGALTCSAVITCTRDAGTGVLTASGATATAAPIAVTATVGAGVTGTLVNYAQVNPAAGETLLESNVLGTGNGGYETGDAAVGSNNDARASLAVNAAPTTIVVTKAYIGDTTKLTTQPSITVQAVCATSGTKSATFTSPATGTISGLIVGESCTLTETSATGAVLTGGYTLSAASSATFTPGATLTTAATNNVTVTNTITAPGAASITVTKAYVGDTSKLTTQPSITVQAVCATSGTKSATFTPPATGSITGLILGESCTVSETAATGAVLATGYTLSAASAATFTPSATLTTAASNAVTVTNTIISPDTFALGNRVWLDANNNGSVDVGELGLDGVVVRLLTPSGTLITSTTTASGGYYLFSGLLSGSYVVEIVPPAGHVTSTGANGLATGPFEPGIAGSALTDDNKDHGSAQASGNIRSGTVTLGAGLQPSGEVRQPGSTDSTPDDRTNLTVDFGLFAPAKLGNLVWIDNGQGSGTANDGVQNGSEAGLNGVTVRVFNAANALIATTTTANNPAGGAPGWYEVTNLTPGQYYVEFTPPSGYSFTSKGAAAVTSGSGPDTSNSQPTATSPRTSLVTLAAGDNNPQLDAGVVLPAAPVSQPIPTLNEWMLMLLSLLMIGLGARRMQATRK
jgi:SdrD B-like domain/Domain of unknown function DUF11/Domain of unknown function (DUF5979)/IPTL-CTERM motif